MQRVHRKLSREEVESLRKELAQLVPAAHTNIPRLLRTMRLITRKSQGEYAKLCGVSPRVVTNLEAGKGKPTVETLEKLLRPFGYKVGVVAPLLEDERITTETRKNASILMQRK
jgi:XRE family transcriptional regulator, regulator of sulfur utilization